MWYFRIFAKGYNAQILELDYDSCAIAYRDRKFCGKWEYLKPSVLAT